MAREPRPGPPRLGKKRQQGTAIFWVCENQRIPPLINQVPARIRRTHMCLGIKGSCSPYKASRKNHLPLAQIKFQTDELHSIREELSQIKAQVDRLLYSLEQMDQQRDQHAGTKDSRENRSPRSEEASFRTTDPQQEPRCQRALPEATSFQGNRHDRGTEESSI